MMSMGVGTTPPSRSVPSTDAQSTAATATATAVQTTPTTTSTTTTTEPAVVAAAAVHCARHRPVPALESPLRARHATLTSCFVLLVLLVLLCSGLPSPVSSQLTPAFFYPFRSQFGDNVTNRSDDGGSGKIDLSRPFPFFGKSYDKLFVNNNGLITFVTELTTYRPKDFPMDDVPLVAPYWADVNVEIGGTVWYRETRDPDILQRATRDVRIYSMGYRRFRASWAFVATWDQVSFYGADGDGRNKRNTFQCVLVSNRLLSFVLFNYGHMDWTTGSNSNGTPTTGLGGNPAQAGVNAGNGINYYEMDGARTDSVINLTHTSNVGIPGRWILRVDLPDSNSDPGYLFLEPSSGSMLGGFPVNVSGSCIERGGSVQGLIVETNRTFPCVEVSEAGRQPLLQCVMPTVFRTGAMTVTLIAGGQRCNHSTSFNFLNAGLVDAKVRRHSPGLWEAGRGLYSVSWNPSLFSPLSQVIVEVLAYTVMNGEPMLVPSNVEPVVSPNKGDKVSVTLPGLKEATLAVIRVKTPHTLINGSFLSHWSDVFPVRWSSSAASADWCSDWLLQEHSRRQLTLQEACPCTLSQAESDTGRWQRDPLCSSDSSMPYNCIYRGSRPYECMVPAYRGLQTVNQRCCYGEDNELLDVREGGGGSMSERYHFRSSQGGEGETEEVVVPWFSYLTEDVSSFLHCCQYSANSSQCDDLRGLRPPVSCQGYDPPAAAQAAGDPHLVTLDGLNYTFNGEGDFVLLQDVDQSIRVHVHAARPIDVDGNLGNATLFTAVAMTTTNETDVLEIRQDEEDMVMVLVNRQEADFTSTLSQLRGMTVYRKQTGNGTVEFTVVMDTARLSVLVVVTRDLLNVMVLVGSAELKGNLKGLLGNYNGKPEDDLIPRYGSPLPVLSSMRDIHYQFGMTWYLPINETLLYHDEDDDTAFQEVAVESMSESEFEPIFIGSINDNDFRNGTQELCQGNLQCMFDFQLTGKESIGQSTRRFSDRFESVKNGIKPVIRCPYVQHIANGNRTMEGQSVGNRVFFTCAEGFTPINGSSTLQCQQSGSWNSSAPDCVVKVDGPDEEDILLYISIGSAVGGFVCVFLSAYLLWCAIQRCHGKYAPKATTETGSETEQGIELHKIFDYSETPNAVFENPDFLDSLHNLRSEEGKFQIPRPRYVDPNIYKEYF